MTGSTPTPVQAVNGLVTYLARSRRDRCPAIVTRDVEGTLA